MKPYLLGSTALATAGLVMANATTAAGAERIQLQVSGYMQQWLVGVDQDFNDGGGQVGPNGAQRLPTTQGFRNSLNNAAFNVDQKTNAEICFVGQTTLDNGITIGVNVQMEAANDAGTDIIDEQYLFVESERFGQLLIGSHDNAASQLYITAPDGGISVDAGDVTEVEMFRDVAGVEGDVATSTDFDLDGDANKITYITPRIYGFQLGVSYIPLFDDTSSNPQLGEELNSGVAAGINYANVFSNGVGVQLSGGLNHFTQTCGTGRQTGGGDLDGSCNDTMQWGAGGQLSYVGFIVGGAYKQSYGNIGDTAAGALVTASGPSMMAAGGAQSRLLNGSAWSVGGAYETGPYTVGVSYIQGRGVGWNIPGTGDFRSRIGSVAGTYLLGPGIRVRGGFFLFDQDSEQVPGARTSAGGGTSVADRNNAAARAAGIQDTSSTSGWGGALALTASF